MYKRKQSDLTENKKNPQHKHTKLHNLADDEDCTDG